MSDAAMQLYDRIADPLDAIDRMGEYLAKSGMFGCEKVEQGKVIAMACLAERKNPIDIAKTYHIIGGKLSMRADAMLAKFREHGGKCVWLNTGDDGDEARARFTFDGNDLEIAFSMEDAKRAGLTKGNWDKNPGAMLRARLTSKAVRMLDPGVVAGVYTPEEISDFTNAPNTATPQAHGLLQKTVDEMPPEKAQPILDIQAEFGGEVEDIQNGDGHSVLGEEVVKALTDHGVAAEAHNWMVERGWLGEEQPVIGLDAPHCKAILTRTDEFVAAIKKDSKDA